MSDNQANQMVSGGAMREKYWHERDREEKLEALRDCVVQLFNLIHRYQETVQALLQHQHSNTGQLMTPMDTREGPIGYSKRYIPTSLNNDLPHIEAGAQQQRGLERMR